MNNATLRPENPLSLAADPRALSYAGVNSSTRATNANSQLSTPKGIRSNQPCEIRTRGMT